MVLMIVSWLIETGWYSDSNTEVSTSLMHWEILSTWLSRKRTKDNPRRKWEWNKSWIDESTRYYPDAGHRKLRSAAADTSIGLDEDVFDDVMPLVTACYRRNKGFFAWSTDDYGWTSSPILLPVIIEGRVLLILPQIEMTWVREKRRWISQTDIGWTSFTRGGGWTPDSHLLHHLPSIYVLTVFSLDGRTGRRVEGSKEGSLPPPDSPFQLLSLHSTVIAEWLPLFLVMVNNACQNLRGHQECHEKRKKTKEKCTSWSTYWPFFYSPSFFEF